MATELNPYASPTTSSSETLLKFRSSALFTAFYIFAWIVLLSLLSGMLQGDVNKQLDMMAATAPQIALYALVFSIAIVWIFPLYVSAKGIRSYTVWGNYDEIAWENIDRVRSINLLGLRYVRLYSVSIRRPILIPLFLSRMTDFVAEVRARTPVEHPLNEFFRSYSTNRTSSR